MQNFLLALQFLTVIPVKLKHYHAKNMGRALIYFPVVGAVLASALLLCATIFIVLGVAQLSIVIAVVALLVILTGGMHLDGLADTADAFCGGETREDILRIMRDPHIGAMGAISIALALLLKTAFLYSLGRSLAPSLVLMCVLSRWSLVGVIYLFPYARRDGKAKIFVQNVNERVFLASTLVALGLALLTWQFFGLLAFVFTGACAYVFGLFLNRRIGGITGDTLGAACEMMEIAVLFGLLIMKGLTNG